MIVFSVPPAVRSKYLRLLSNPSNVHRRIHPVYLRNSKLLGNPRKQHWWSGMND